jgi:hypothetical protein
VPGGDRRRIGAPASGRHGLVAGSAGEVAEATLLVGRLVAMSAMPEPDPAKRAALAWTVLLAALAGSAPAAAHRHPGVAAYPGPSRRDDAAVERDAARPGGARRRPPVRRLGPAHRRPRRRPPPEPPPGTRLTLQGPRALLVRFTGAKPDQVVVVLAEHRPGPSDLFVLTLDLCPAP